LSPARSVFFLLTPLSPPCTLFPYTTLFRSRRPGGRPSRRRAGGAPSRGARALRVKPPLRRCRPLRAAPRCGGTPRYTRARDFPRSEEHTSELQSRENLVCRLLLEKKNRTNH